MQTFPSGISFKFPWRIYQERVLGELDEHLNDSHLHLIAPPGSGKTVLGLEVALRLNEPTLVLAPTLTIRNQWVQRFYELFLQTKQEVRWISRDIGAPGFLTVDTYQALHAVFSDDEQEGNNARKIVESLKAKDVGTIIVDEAHHLRNAWWQSLTAVKQSLNPTVVGLTATPPYDVSYAEWQRYIALNGPVDAEISVPELVAEGNLCPHQDYVQFSRPTGKEFQEITRHRDRIEKLFQALKEETPLIEALEQHPIYREPKKHLDWIYANLESFSATLIYLHDAGKPVTEKHLDIIGDKDFQIPELNYKWIEILLTFYLYEESEYFKAHQSHREALLNKLKRNGAIAKRAINFRHHRSIDRSLASSTSKLKSIDQIVDFEYQQLRGDLRLVILTDYIRKDFLVDGKENNRVLNKMGVIPIFERLRRTNNHTMKLGVLTGSLLIIPFKALLTFKDIAAKYGVTDISAEELTYDSRYLNIELSGEVKKYSVTILTELFQKGGVEVLTGTKSLLGEGWDAPFINALILASFVGSHMLSNQMRGRAIRTDPQSSDKTSNIWHLVCLDPTAKDGGDDIRMLNRRMENFVGISFEKEGGIRNGAKRLGLPEELDTVTKIEQANAAVFERASQRNQLKEQWQNAIKHGTTLVEEIKAPFPSDRDYTQTKELYYNKTIAYLLGLVGTGFAGMLEWIFRGVAFTSFQFDNPDVVFWVLIAVTVISGGLFGLQLYKTTAIYIKYRDISKDIHQIGKALLQSLIEVEAIKTRADNLDIMSEVDDVGAIYCRLDGGTTYEKSVFLEALEEIISPVESPRYVIIRKSTFLSVMAQRDYHAVPEILGKNKETATHFQQQWDEFVGSSELVYTRSIQGRKLLLKSRIKSLSSQFEDRTERVNRWK